jgi:hypothetical protein
MRFVTISRQKILGGEPSQLTKTQPRSRIGTPSETISAISGRASPEQKAMVLANASGSWICKPVAPGGQRRGQDRLDCSVPSTTAGRKALFSALTFLIRGL